MTNGNCKLKMNNKNVAPQYL